MAYQRFDTNEGLQALEDVAFDLAGVAADGTPWVEHFECLRWAPAGLTARMAACFSWSDGTAKVSVAATIEALRGAIADVGDQRARYEALINDPERMVDASHLGEVVWWLQEHYTGRPTQRQPGSPNGSLPNGQSSTPDSELQASTPPPSPPTAAPG